MIEGCVSVILQSCHLDVLISSQENTNSLEVNYLGHLHVLLEGVDLASQVAVADLRVTKGAQKIKGASCVLCSHSVLITFLFSPLIRLFLVRYPMTAGPTYYHLRTLCKTESYNRCRSRYFVQYVQMVTGMKYIQKHK